MPTPSRSGARRIWLAASLACAAFLLLTGGLFATRLAAADYIIDTNDSAITDWVDQGIVAFQTDPVGDTGIGSDDVVTAWVANAIIPPPTGQNTPSLAFRVQLAQPPIPPQLLRGIAAMIDCDRNGIDNERQDRWVVYNMTGPRLDDVTLYTGDQAFGLIPTAILPGFLGQKVKNNLEWAIPIVELPIRGDEPAELGTVVDCRGKVDIRIASLQYVTPTGFIVLDTLTPPLGWDVAAGVPLSATLEISQPTGTLDAQLDWNATAQSAEYEVLRSTEAYAGFAPFGSTPSTTFTDDDAATIAEPLLFYQVRGTTGGVPTVAESNTQGLVKFVMYPGDPEPG